jgi:molybdate transport system ATP-binding protein
MLQATLRLARPTFSLEAEFEVPPGRTLVLVGESGAGKTTVLRLLAGLERPDSGRIVLDGEVWYDGALGTHLPPQQRDVGWVPQDYALFPHLSVRENLRFGLTARGVPRTAQDARLDAALEQVGITDLAARPVSSLSGGQQQRVALARALAPEPRLLLLDEPLAALDLRTRRLVRGELRRLLAATAGPAILVTHHPVEALQLGDLIAVMERGRIAQVGERDALLRHPRSAFVAEFMGLNLLQGRVLERLPDGVTVVEAAGGVVTLAGPTEGSELFLAISPREITLYRAAPDGSAQNVYRGRIREIMPEPPLGERVRVSLDTHPPLVAEVTRAAVERLGLAEGEEVYAAFKATGVAAYA